MKKKSIITIIAVCAAIGAAVAAVILFHDEIVDFVKKIINKIDTLRGGRCCDCCDDDFDVYDDFDDFEDVSSPF